MTFKIMVRVWDPECDLMLLEIDHEYETLEAAVAFEELIRRNFLNQNHLRVLISCVPTTVDDVMLFKLRFGGQQ